MIANNNLAFGNNILNMIGVEAINKMAKKVFLVEAGWMVVIEHNKIITTVTFKFIAF